MFEAYKLYSDWFDVYKGNSRSNDNYPDETDPIGDGRNYKEPTDGGWPPKPNDGGWPPTQPGGGCDTNGPVIVTSYDLNGDGGGCIDPPPPM